MTKGMVEHIKQWVNAFPSSVGITGQYSPSNIIDGTENLDCNRNRIVFGAYAQAYTGTTNDMKSRTTPVISLYESNGFDGQYFMSLNTGRRIHARKWTQLPIDDTVVNGIQSIAAKENQPMLPSSMPLFEWAPGLNIDLEPYNENVSDDTEENTIADELALEVAGMPPIEKQNVVSDSESDDDGDDLSSDDEEVAIIDEESHSDDVTDSIEIKERILDTPVNEPDDGESPPDDEEISSCNSDDFSFNMEAVDDNDIDSSDKSIEPNVIPAIDETNDHSISRTDNVGSDDEYIPNEEEPSEDEVINVSQPRPSRTCANQGIERLEMKFGSKEYASIKSKQFLSINNRKGLLRKAIGIILAQMSAEKGIKTFGHRAVAAMIKELKQLDDGPMPGKRAVCPIDPDSLTKDQKSMALEAVNLIQEKRDGRIKGRTCANGAKQRKYVKEGEIDSSPTAALESIVSTLLIDAYEKRYVAIADVPGAYLHALMPADKLVLLKLRGKFVDIMCQVNPEYKPYVRYEGKCKVLYLHVLRAIYGCLESALLWYNLYSSTLQKLGFTLNPYDLCVANKVIDGSQCTIVFYVDDNKISHKDPKVVKNVINEIKKYFGELTVESGNAFNFLGMNIKIRNDKKIEIKMKNQIEEALDWFGENINEKPANPANKNLLNTDSNALELNQEKSDVFHSIVAKILYLCKRARPDIETAVSSYVPESLKVRPTIGKSCEEYWPF